MPAEPSMTAPAREAVLWRYATVVDTLKDEEIAHEWSDEPPDGEPDFPTHPPVEYVALPRAAHDEREARVAGLEQAVKDALVLLNAASSILGDAHGKDQVVVTITANNNVIDAKRTLLRALGAAHDPR